MAAMHYTEESPSCVTLLGGSTLRQREHEGSMSHEVAGIILNLAQAHPHKTLDTQNTL